VYIGLAYDLKDSVQAEQSAADDALEEYDIPETVDIIASALRSKGHQVAMLGGGTEFLNNILGTRVDFVFNISEGRGNYRSRESQVPAVLEMLHIPYSGSDPYCLALCLDKPLTKKLVEEAGVRTPKSRTIRNREEMYRSLVNSFPFPAIVKPACEGSSKGIRLDSLVHEPHQVIDTVENLLESYNQPVMLEEFIEGDEVTVGIVGNSPAHIAGIMRIIPRQKDRPFVYSLEVKRDWKKLVDYECPALLDKAVLDRIKAYSLNVFNTLGCRDFARIDFRIGRDGTPYFLEINPLPGLGTYSDLIIMAIKMGLTHEGLIGNVLDAALERYPQCIHA
jgi:D-alanine-D-alanine ligase